MNSVGFLNAFFGFTAERALLFILAFFFSGLMFGCPTAEATQWDINYTKHNLSVTGPGEFRALTESRICIFCHTPHNAFPRTPLWNRDLPIAETYTPYDSTTMAVKPSVPTGPSRLCLSCHDGTVALGAVRRPSSKILMRGAEIITPEKLSYLGTILTDDHPISFSYKDAVGNPRAGLASEYPQELVPYPDSFVQCTSCHEPHRDVFRSPDKYGVLTGKFLVADNRNSALCTMCHSRIDGWDSSDHKTSTRAVNAKLPVSPKKWPAWQSVAEWGCEGCHTAHSAGGPQRLFYYLENEENCFICHDGSVAQKDISARFGIDVLSQHPVTDPVMRGLHDPKESPVSIENRHVECADCHNPHALKNEPASAPYVPGNLAKVSGMSLEGGPKSSATYEYEICFKCHVNEQQVIPYIWRVINERNLRIAFAPENPSFHPVTWMGRNQDVPSLPSEFEPLLMASSMIYCTDCHSDNAETGTRGPHGSKYRPILKYRYETSDFTPESFANYELCYHCHDRNNTINGILNDASFRKKALGTTQSWGGHSGHLAQNVPCSACHDAHGIPDDGTTGSHTNLINFDRNIVLPASGNLNPFFRDTGLFSGNCTLVCHGRPHINETYP